MVEFEAAAEADCPSIPNGPISETQASISKWRGPTVSDVTAPRVPSCLNGTTLESELSFAVGAASEPKARTPTTAAKSRDGLKTGASTRCTAG